MHEDWALLNPFHILFWTNLRASCLQLHTALCWVLGRLQHPSGSGDSTQRGKKIKQDPDEELLVFWGFCIRLLSQMYTVWELRRSVESSVSTALALAGVTLKPNVTAQSLMLLRATTLYPPLLPSEESCKMRCGFWGTEATIGEEHLFISAGKWKFEDFSSECPNFSFESHRIRSTEDGWRHTWVKKFSQGISKFTRYLGRERSKNALTGAQIPINITEYTGGACQKPWPSHPVLQSCFSPPCCWCRQSRGQCSSMMLVYLILSLHRWHTPLHSFLWRWCCQKTGNLEWMHWRSRRERTKWWREVLALSNTAFVQWTELEGTVFIGQQRQIKGGPSLILVPVIQTALWRSRSPGFPCCLPLSFLFLPNLF